MPFARFMDSLFGGDSDAVAEHAAAAERRNSAAAKAAALASVAVERREFPSQESVHSPVAQPLASTAGEPQEPFPDQDCEDWAD